MLKKDQAICLRTVNYSETSQVLTLLARECGKLSAIAKGSRRPRSSFDGPVEVLSFGDIVFAPSRSGKLSTLTEFQQKSIFPGLRKNLFKLNSALFAVELLDAMTQEFDEHANLFDSFVRFLTGVQETENDTEILSLLILFQLTLLSEIGTKPVLSRCANCKTVFSDKWPAIYFSNPANGIICQDCEQNFTDKIRLSFSAAQCLSDLKRIAKTTTETLKEIEKILICHFTHLMHKPPKMATYFLKK